jgi:hypothetical protein
MAQKHFLVQAVRRRSGPVATGEPYEVRLTAGGALAYVSLTNGGPQVAGSIVLTDPAQGSLDLWGPTDDTDELYVRSVNDQTLGWQRITADPDSRLDVVEGRLGAVVYVSDYTKGDGSGETEAQQTAGLAAAVAAAAGKVLEFEQGKTYVHNNTLSPANNTIIRGNGAALKAGSAKTGNLDTDARQLSLSSVTGVVVEGLRFLAPVTAFTAATADRATIWLSNAVDCQVRRCRFETTGVREAVFVRGTSARDNRVEGNYLDGSGIRYSYDGASRTFCVGNTILNAPDNALTGTGNNGGGAYNQDCLVADNYIDSPARMGIEDWSLTRGTVIRNNRIRNTAHYSISAVGRETLIQGNTILDPALTVGIEVASNGMRVVGNSIRYVTATPTTAISVNGNASLAFKGCALIGNYVEGAAVGISFASTVLSVRVISNGFVNCTTGIDTFTTGHLTAIGNQFRWTVAGSGARVGINAGPNSIVAGNTFAWESGAGGGTGSMICVRPTSTADYARIFGNLFDGGGVISPSVPIGVSSNGSTPTGVRIHDNTFVGGATLVTTSMVSPVAYANGGSTSSINSVDIFATQVPSGQLTKTGLYYAAPVVSRATGTPTLNDLRLAPFLLGETTTFDRIAVDVNTGGSAGAVVRLGIYADSGDGYPGALILDAGTVDATATGLLTITINQQLTPGLYWIGGVPQVATSVVHVSTGSALGIGIGVTTLAQALWAGYSQTSVSGALPSTFTGTVTAATQAVRALLRAA